LSLLELTPTCMTLELAYRSVSKPIGIAKNVLVKVGVFHFPVDFVVVDFEPDPRVPLILGRCFLKTDRALIDVHKEVLGFSNVTTSGNRTPRDDLIISTTSPTLTPFGDSDFLLFEEANAFLGLGDDPNSPKINPFYYDPEGDILLLKAILNSKLLPLLPNHEQYLPSFKKELKVCEAKTVKSSVDEPLEVELKDLPPYLEYVFLEGDNKLPMLEILAGNEFYCFLDGFFGYFQIPIDPRDQEKQRSPVLMEHLPIDACLSACAMHRARFKGEKQRSPVLMEHLPIDACLSACAMHRARFKEKLTEAPILIAPNWDLPFELMCDASDFAIGAVLGQRHEKHFRPIHYASKTMTDAESNYTTTEKEMLAVVYAFEKFRSYLIMKKIIVHTDHSALKYLFAKKDDKARLLRSVLLL
nr:reverse transcriptase domain-containing protein [Tanacetum cinerariifolium]